MPKNKTGLLPNRIISLWDYSEMDDERVYYGKNYITITNIPGKSNPYKLGLNNEAGWGAVFNNGQLFIKYFDPTDGFYPDNGCTYETYTNGVMTECESLSPVWNLEPGEEESFFEEWEFYAEDEVPGNDEAEIERIMNKHLGK
jgi:hypothetical protein